MPELELKKGERVEEWLKRELSEGVPTAEAVSERLTEELCFALVDKGVLRDDPEEDDAETHVAIGVALALKSLEQGKPVFYATDGEDMTWFFVGTEDEVLVDLERVKADAESGV